MNNAAIDISEDIPGVFRAKQKRSIRIRDEFILAGVEALNEMRLVELSVSQLAVFSGNSVGSFYTRFKDKDAYFRALRAYAIESIDLEIESRFTVPILRDQKRNDALHMLVDLLADIFTSRFRGVFRESLLRILEPDDPWAPMRKSAQQIIATLHAGLDESSADQNHSTLQTKLSFCFQMIVGVLQNDLVNDYHVFSTRDHSIRQGLKDAVCSYIECETRK